MSRRLAAELPGATLQEIEHLGHMAVLHAAGDLMPLLQAHLARLDPPPAPTAP